MIAAATKVIVAMPINFSEAIFRSRGTIRMGVSIDIVCLILLAGGRTCPDAIYDPAFAACIAYQVSDSNSRLDISNTEVPHKA